MSTFYINQWGTKSSEKLDKITDAARKYLYGGNGWSIQKNDSMKMTLLRRRFEKEVKNIGGVDYNFTDCLS